MKSRIEGVVSITVTDSRGEELSIEPDGYLGRLDVGSITIHFQVAPTSSRSGRTLHFLIVEGREKETVKEMKDWAPKRTPERYYRRRVAVVPGHQGNLPYPSPLCNSLQVLEVLPDGQFNLWEISIVSSGELFWGEKIQGGRSFLVEQLVYETICCYRNGSEIVCPRFKKTRPELAKFICQLPEIANTELPSFQEYQEAKEPSFPGLQPGRGVVLWFNQRQGYGALAIIEGTAYVHRNEAGPRWDSRLPFLKTGEVVSIGSLERQTGEHSFPFRAHKVELITTRLD